MTTPSATPPMSMRTNARSGADRCRSAVCVVRDRLDLSRRGLAAVIAAVTVLAGVTMSFADLSEDVAGHDGLARHDASHLQFFVHHRTAQLVEVSRWLADVGSVGVLVALAAIVAALLWWRGARLIVCLAPGLALGLAGACVAIGKQVVGRARPPVRLRLITETAASFPSGHAADSTAFYVTLAVVVAVVLLRRPLARVGTVAIAALLSAAIGISRLVLGVHWPTDVLAGWMLGTIVAMTVSLFTVLATRFVDRDDAPPEGRLGRFARRLARLLLSARPAPAARLVR